MVLSGIRRWMVGSFYGFFPMGSIEDEEWLFWQRVEVWKVCNVQECLLAVDDGMGWNGRRFSGEYMVILLLYLVLCKQAVSVESEMYREVEFPM